MQLVLRLDYNHFYSRLCVSLGLDRSAGNVLPTATATNTNTNTTATTTTTTPHAQNSPLYGPASVPVPSARFSPAASTSFSENGTILSTHPHPNPVRSSYSTHPHPQSRPATISSSSSATTAARTFTPSS